ncbi:MAG: hypothetical protein WB471_06410 [Nocardioides sp.]
MSRRDDEIGAVMDWWGWAIIALVVLALLVALVLGVQARRRRGGVIVGGPGEAVDDAPASGSAP